MPSFFIINSPCTHTPERRASNRIQVYLPTCSTRRSDTQAQSHVRNPKTFFFLASNAMLLAMRAHVDRAGTRNHTTQTEHLSEMRYIPGLNLELSQPYKISKAQPFLKRQYAPRRRLTSSSPLDFLMSTLIHVQHCDPIPCLRTSDFASHQPFNQHAQ